MICQTCSQEFEGPRCPCGWEGPTTGPRKGQTLRLNRCDVPGCQRVVSAGDPEKNFEMGFKLPIRCRFHRDPSYHDPVGPTPIRVVPDTGPPISLEEFGREQFDRIRQAAGEELRAYWAEQGIVVKPAGPAPKGWESAGKTMRKWADKYFPPV